MTPVSPDQRQDILRSAARFTTDHANAEAVVINAGVLLAWAEEAATERDLLVRLRALGQQSINTYMARDDPAALVVADDPDAFLRGARVLYAFATAGEEAS